MQQPSVAISEPNLPGRVVVLLSAYNGSEFIVEQIRSILEQLPPSGRVIVRDDGSIDGTTDVVNTLKDDRVLVERGNNLGFGASFLTLLSLVPDDARVVMFSDQDDVWLPGKIGRAGAALARCGDAPALYGSAQMLVDEALRPLGPTAPWPAGPSFRGALTENIITGCTAALNAPAVRLLRQAGAAPGVHFHDWWCYLVISAFGQVVFDDQPTLLYRQHGRNQIGHGAGWWGRQRQIVRFLLRNDWVGILMAQVQALDAHYGAQLPAEARGLLDRYFARSVDGLAPGWRLVFSTQRWRQHWHGEIALRLLLAAWRVKAWPLAGRRLQTQATAIQSRLMPSMSRDEGANR
jgi:glycosyltransferase involved in cell wall biosynthesis